eukprot:6900753-Alexandrium_andersonii.AAC.1
MLVGSVRARRVWRGAALLGAAGRRLRGWTCDGGPASRRHRVGGGCFARPLLAALEARGRRACLVCAGPPPQ